jgi:hypothetical protein
MEARAERLFLTLLTTTYEAGAWRSPNPSARNYAPNCFAHHPDRYGLGKPAIEAAMHRLIKTGRIRIETYGRPSAPSTRLALA